MSKRWPYLLPLAVIAILFAIFGKRLFDIENGADPHLLPTVLLNTPMPAFTLPGLPGRSNAQTFTADDLKGRVSLVNVWGSWCIACLQEHPTLLEIQRSGLIPIHGIAWRDTPDKASAWLQQRGDPYAMIGQDPDSNTAIALGVSGAPETFLVDAQGVIRYKQVGPITPEVWKTVLKPLIAQLQK